MATSTSQEGIQIISHFEGCHLKAYWDKHGQVWTIGYGFTGTMSNGQRVVQGLTITKDFAIRELPNRLKRDFEGKVNNKITRPLKQNEFDALVDLAYNRGSLTEDLIAAVNSNNLDATICAFMRIITSKGVVLGGLVRRRSADVYLFFKGMDKNMLRKKIISCAEGRNKGPLTEKNLAYTNDTNWKSDTNFQKTEPIQNYNYASNEVVNNPPNNNNSTVKTETQIQQKNVENNYNGVFLFSSNYTPETPIQETKSTNQSKTTTERSDADLKQVIDNNVEFKDNPNIS